MAVFTLQYPTAQKDHPASAICGNPVVDATIDDYGFYLEDQSRIAKRLTFNVGARYQYAQLPQPTLTNADYPRTAHLPTGKLNLAPRTGLTIPIHERLKLYVNFEVFNVSKTISDNSITSQAYTEAKGLLTLTPASNGVGTADGGFPDGAQARRIKAPRSGVSCV